jgi:predicted RNA-binding protein with PUA-like domain
MAYWLIKSEPDVYPYAQLVQDCKTAWTGIRNYAARINLRAMAVGDECLFYHSNTGKEIVGVATVVAPAYLDPTATEGEWYCVDVAPKLALPKPLSLAEVKADAILKNMELVRLSRLSVAKITKEEFDRVLMLGGV